MIYRKKDVYEESGRIKAHHTVLLTLKNTTYVVPIPIGMPTGTEKQQYDYYIFEEDGNSDRKTMLCVFSPSQKRPERMTNELRIGAHLRIKGIARKQYPLYSPEAVHMAQSIGLQVKPEGYNTPSTCSGAISVKTVTRI
jgi:hypothetical protein